MYRQSTNVRNIKRIGGVRTIQGANASKFKLVTSSIPNVLSIGRIFDVVGVQQTKNLKDEMTHVSRTVPVAA